MVDIYNSELDGHLLEIDEVVDGCWINMINPSEKEITQYSEKLDIDIDFIKAALDTEERSRLEHDEDNDSVLLVVDFPYIELDNESRVYETIPIGIIYTNQCIVTVCTTENLVLKRFLSKNVKGFYTYKKVRFMLQILFRISTLYIEYLKQINKHTIYLEEALAKNLSNNELKQILYLEKSLIYFSTSLRSNDFVLERLKRFRFVNQFEEDEELIEDILIENKQALDMAKIYTTVLENMMVVYSTIISNNVNHAMKILTALTVVAAIPTFITGFFGMNVYLPYSELPIMYIMIFIFSLCACYLAMKIMRTKNLL